MILFCCLTLLSYDLSQVGAEMESEPFRQSVLIPLGAQSLESPFQVLWKRGNKLMGKFHNGKCNHGCSERSHIFSNGSLFLSPVQREDEGKYSAEVYDASGTLTHHAEVLLQIVDVSADQMTGTPGPSVLLSLDNGSLEPPFLVLWKKGEQQLGKIVSGTCVYGCNETAQIFSNGSLFLTHLQRGDRGKYSAEVYDANGFLNHKAEIVLYINVSGVETPKQQPKPERLSLSALIFICEAAVFSILSMAIMCLGIFLWRWRKRRMASDEHGISYATVHRSPGTSRVELNNIGNTLDTKVGNQETGTSMRPDGTPNAKDLSTFKSYQDSK